MTKRFDDGISQRLCGYVGTEQISEKSSVHTRRLAGAGQSEVRVALHINNCAEAVHRGARHRQ